MLFFLSLLPEFKPITSHHVICHVTTVTYLFIVTEK